MAYSALTRLSAAALFALLPSFCMAADNTGTTGANFLKIPVAPIPSGMGQAYTAISAVDSILYNPAGLGLLSYSAMSAAHNQYVADIKQEYLALAVRTDIGTFGAAYSALSSGDFDSYDDYGSRTGTTNTSHSYAILSYAQSFPHWNQDRNQQDRQLMLTNWAKIPDVEFYRPASMRFSFGGSIKYIRERLDDVSDSAVTFDAGAIIVPVRRVQLGISLLNISGNQNFGTESFDLPRTLRIGAASDFVSRHKLMVIRPALDYVKENDNDAYFCVGLEVSAMEMLQFRIGSRAKHDLGTGTSMGAGISLDKFSSSSDGFMRGARFDYAYINEGVFTASHRFGLQILFH